MTATNRSSKLSASADNYPTPAWAVRRFLDKWAGAHEVGPRWLEPCAGDGSIIRAVNAWRAERGLPPVEWTATEFRDVDVLSDAVYEKHDRGHVFVKADFVGKRIVRIAKPGKNGKPKITSKIIETPDQIFTFPERVLKRPPWSLAVNGPAPSKKPFDVVIMNPPFLLTMAFLTRCLELADVVIMLQRQNFIGGKKRNRWMRKNHPDFYMLPDRISFSGDGSTDAIGHGWYTWEGENADGVGIFQLLEHTPAEERKGDMPRLGLRRPMPETGAPIRVRRKKTPGPRVRRRKKEAA